MDHHTVSAISIMGSSLDVLGSLHGPLRVLTRAVTYSVVFGIGYGLGLGLFFGLSAGIATGLTCRSSSIEPLAGWTITPGHGKRCFPPSAGSVSALDCT